MSTLVKEADFAQVAIITSSPNTMIPKTMNACLYDSKAPSGVSLAASHPTPTSVSSPSLISPGNVIVKVYACGVNPVDAKYVIGDKFPETWMDWCARRITGHTPGFDFSGKVVKVPRNCHLKVGDEVYGLASDPSKMMVKWLKGSFAEFTPAPLNQIALKPKNLTHAEAAALPLVGTTACQAFAEHGLKAGHRVLIVGASGGVGHIAVQVASLQGAHVVAVCSGSNAEHVTQCGAKVVLDYREGDIFEKVSGRALTRNA